MRIRTLPLTRERAKARARKLQNRAAEAGNRLGYAQALVQVAKAAGYANVNQMTAQYGSPEALAAAAARPTLSFATRKDFAGQIEALAAANGSAAIVAGPSLGVIHALRTHFGEQGVVEIRLPWLSSQAANAVNLLDGTLGALRGGVSRGARVVWIEMADADDALRRHLLEGAAERRIFDFDAPPGVAILLRYYNPIEIGAVARLAPDLRPEEIIHFSLADNVPFGRHLVTMHPVLAKFLALHPEHLLEPARAEATSLNRPTPLSWALLSQWIGSMGSHSALELADVSVGRAAAQALRAWLAEDAEAAARIMTPALDDPDVASMDLTSRDLSVGALSLRWPTFSASGGLPFSDVSGSMRGDTEPTPPEFLGRFFSAAVGGTDFGAAFAAPNEPVTGNQDRRLVIFTDGDPTPVVPDLLQRFAEAEPELVGAVSAETWRAAALAMMLAEFDRGNPDQDCVGRAAEALRAGGCIEVADRWLAWIAERG